MTRPFLSLLAVIPLIAGCSGSTLFGYDDVTYTLDPVQGPECSGEDDVNRYTSGTYQTINCVWYCNNYKGQEGVYVSLTFEKSISTEQKWVLDREYISGGIC